MIRRATARARALAVLLAAAGSLALGAPAAHADAFPWQAIDTQVTHNGHPAIQVGDQFYDGADAGASTPPRLHVVVLDRTTLTQQLNTTYSCSDALFCLIDLEAMLNGLGGAASSHLVIAASHPGYASWAEMASGLGRIGFWQVPGMPTGGGTLSVIGVKDTPPGSATQAVDATGRVDGYLMAGYLGRFSFQAPEHPRYSFSPDGGVLTLGSHAYVSQPEPAGSGGFRVWAFDEKTLAPLFGGEGGHTFATRQADAGAAGAAQLAMYEYLDQIPGGHVVVVRSYGDWFAPSQLAFWVLAVRKLGDLGAFSDTLNRDTGPYALVGWVGAGQAGGQEFTGSTAGAHVGTVTGFLLPNHQQQFRPRLPDPLGNSHGELLDVLLAPPSQFPFTAPGAQHEAYLDINQRLGLSVDLRQQYWSEPGFEWSSTLTALDNLTYQADPDFTSADFTTVKNELASEIGWVQRVQSYLVASTGLRAPFASSGVVLSSWSAVSTIASQITSEYDAGDAGVQIDPSAIVNGALNLGWAVGSGGVSQAFGVLTSAYTVALGLGDSGSGVSAADPFTTTVNAAGSDLASRFTTAQSGFDRLAEIVLSDHDKLQTVGTKAMGGDAAWQWTDDDKDGAGQALEIAIRRHLWAELLPARYHVADLGPYASVPIHRANDLQCRNTLTFPFLHEPDSGQVALTADFGTKRVLALTAGNGHGGYQSVPTAELTDKLFKPLDGNALGASSPLGIDKARFFYDSFQFRDFDCKVFVGATPPPAPKDEAQPPSAVEPIAAPPGPALPLSEPVKLLVSGGRVKATTGRPVRVQYVSKESGRAELRILKGRRVVAIERRTVHTGRNRVTWDGRWDRRTPRRVARPGLYRLRLEVRTASGRHTRHEVALRIAHRRGGQRRA